MALLARLRGLSRGKLWTGFLISLAANVAAAVYVAVYLPIIRLQPVCTNRASFSFLLHAPIVEVEGEMAFLFFHEFHRMIGGYHHRAHDMRLYVPLAAWLDRDWASNMSYKATTALLAARTGATIHDVSGQKLGLPGFDEVRFVDWPPCDAMRKLAIEGGEWNREGPVPDPEVLKRRAERGLR